jgi:hypothetical protein
VKYIISDTNQVDTLNVGELGVTSTCRILGSAVFKSNGLNAITITGVTDLEIEVRPNVYDEIAFAEVFVADTRAEEYVILTPEYAKRWQLPFLSGGLTEHMVGGYKNELYYRDLSDPDADAVAQGPTALDPSLHPYLTKILISDQDRLRAVHYNAETVPPKWRIMETGRQRPLAYGVARLEGDRRRQAIVTAQGRIYWFDHEDVAEGSSDLSAQFYSAEFIRDKGEIVGLVACTSGGTLQVFNVNVATRTVALKFRDSSRRWLNARQLPDSRNVIAVSAGGFGNVFSVNLDTKAVAGILANFHGLRSVTDAAGEGVVALDADGNCKLVSLTGDVLRTFADPVMPLQFVDPRVAHEGAYTTGTDLIIGGQSVGYAEPNTLGVHVVNGKRYSISNPRTRDLAYTLSSDDLKPTIEVLRKVVEENTVILEVRVTGKDGIAYPISVAESTPAIAVYPADTAKTITHAYSGDVVQFRIPAASVRDNKMFFAIGRSALVEGVLPDSIPNPFKIEDIEGAVIGEQSFTLPFTPKGYDAPAVIKSNGEIWVDDVVVESGSLIQPGSTIRIKVIHGPATVSSWWCEVGGVRASFFSMSNPQRVTPPTLGRAYAPRTKIESKPIINPYTDAELIFELSSAMGNIKGREGVRSVVLGPGQHVILEFDVGAFGRYEIPYRFGRSDHVWKVWADDHFLDPYPTTSEAERHVEAESPAFLFAAIPSDFFMIASVPAGIIPTLDGEFITAPADARKYNSESREVELTPASVLTYTGIPFSGGRELDFGDVVARWVYPPKLADSFADSDMVITLPAAKVNVVVDHVETAPALPTTLAEVSHDPEIVMHRHQGQPIRTHATYDAVFGVDGVAAPVAWGSEKYEPEARQIRMPSSFERRTPISVRPQQTHEIDSAIYHAPRPRLAHEIQSAPALARHIPQMQSWYGTDYQFLASTKSYQPDSFNFHQYVDPAAYKLDGATPKAQPVAQTYGGVLNAGREANAISTVASEPAVRNELSPQVSLAALEAQSFKVTHGQSLESAGPNEKRTLGYYKLEVSSQEYLRPSQQGVPLRPLHRILRFPDSGDIWPKYFVPYQPTQILNISAQSVDVRQGSRYNSVMLSGRYEQSSKARVHLEASQAMGASSHRLAVIGAQVFVPSAVSHAEASASRLQIGAVFPADSATAVSIAPQGAKDFEQRFAQFIPKVPHDFAPRKVVMEEEGMVHDGNVPTLLDRGYFATELEALQNATQVWKMEPQNVAGRQLPNGMWYWIQLDFCYNMCKECPPYGYISGG